MISSCACRRAAATDTLASEMFATALVAGGRTSSSADEPGIDASVVVAGVRECRLDRRRLDVDGADRSEPEQRSGDREHARPAADVEQRAGLDVLQQLQTELRGRVRAGTERATGVDHDGEQVGRCLVPGRPDPEAAHLDRPVEGPPALLPSVLDIGRLRRAEHVPDALLARCVRVGDELGRTVAVDLLEPVREEREHGRPRLLEAGVADLDGDTAERAQRNALFSLSKKPSSWR